MIYKIVLFLSLFFLCAFIKAQQKFIGLKGGINLTNVTDNNIFNHKINKTGYSGGITYEYFYKKKISIGCDLLYSQVGFGNYYALGDILDPINGSSIQSETLLYYQYEYINIPLKCSFYFGSNTFLYGSFGLVPGFLINAKTFFDRENKATNDTKRVTKFELKGQVEFGLGVKLNKKIKLYSSLLYFNGFTQINNSEYYSSGNIKNYGYNLSIGINYCLK